MSWNFVFLFCCCLVSIVMVRVRMANSSGGRIRGVLPVVRVTILLCFGSRVNLCVVTWLFFE